MSRRHETYNNLIEAFWGVYKKKPLSKITVKEVTDRAGYNRGTFYSYFTDIYEVQEILKDSIMPEESMIIGPLKQLAEGNGKVMESIERTNEYIRKNGDIIAVLIGPEGDPSFVYEFKMKIRKMIMKYVGRQGVKNPEHIEYVIEYHISGIINVFRLWMEKEEEIDEGILKHMMEDVSHNGAVTILNLLLNDKKDK